VILIVVKENYWGCSKLQQDRVNLTYILRQMLGQYKAKGRCDSYARGVLYPLFESSE
jgi:hypothetical protein